MEALQSRMLDTNDATDKSETKDDDDDNNNDDDNGNKKNNNSSKQQPRGTMKWSWSPDSELKDADGKSSSASEENDHSKIREKLLEGAHSDLLHVNRLDADREQSLEGECEIRTRHPSTEKSLLCAAINGCCTPRDRSPLRTEVPRSPRMLDANRKRKLILHLDLRNTILVADSITNVRFLFSLCF